MHDRAAPGCTSTDQLAASLQEARAALLRPDLAGIHRCCAALDRSTSLLRRLLAAEEPSGPSREGLRTLASGLQRELARVGRLLESAAAFDLGWRRSASLQAGGYTASGEAAALPARHRFSVDG